MQGNITWIADAKKNKMVVGSQARILYADAKGRTLLNSRKMPGRENLEGLFNPTSVQKA